MNCQIFMRWICLAAVLCVSAGCGLFRSDKLDDGPRLAEELKNLPSFELAPSVAVVANEAEVLEAYRAIYGRVTDADENHQVGKRLADLELRRAEGLDADGAGQNPYVEAVELYEELLAKSEAGEIVDGQRDKLLYQLAQAHDLAGGAAPSEAYLNELIRDYGEGPYALEARFRRGEMRFSQRRYREAADDYSVVNREGGATPFWLHATYMLGWSRFKESDLELASARFYEVVEATTDVDDGKAIESELQDDALRVLMLALEYRDGAESLAADMRGLDRPGWQYRVYQRLAADYLGQQRFLDGVGAWQTFVDENPLDARAPRAHVGMIETLLAADFPSEVEPKKVEFVARYGVRSEFWQVHDEDVRAGYAKELGDYLGELSTLRHATAQASGKPADYLAAADLYEQRLETFPAAPNNGDIVFLLGEVYTDAGEQHAALSAYRRLVSDYPEHPQAPDAGYASILALSTLAEAARDRELADLQQQHLDAQILFAATFPDDPRAPAVQAASADRLFQIGDYERAVATADVLLERPDRLTPDLINNALLVVGHGNMELERYARAESAYTSYLTKVGSDDAVSEKLLASVYKQGEQEEGAGAVSTALSHYLRIAEIAPDAELAATAHYDAIAMLESAGETTRVAELLQSFREAYPRDARVADVPSRLASLFEAQESYTQAAVEYLNVAAAGTDPEQSRQAHYRAAELFLADNDPEAALHEFVRYSERYAEPADVHFEALHQQDELLRTLGKERVPVWEDKVAAYRRAGRAATKRMTYLSAAAHLELAHIDRSQFDLVRLEQPLKKTLRQKQKRLKTAIDSYQKVIAYGVADFGAAANFQIADVYVALSRSIMESQRPRGLNEMELEQYEILLEEQAYPFEEQAIELHEVNLQRMWTSGADEWTERSLAALRVLMPGRFDKNEIQVAYVETIH